MRARLVVSLIAVALVAIVVAVARFTTSAPSVAMATPTALSPLSGMSATPAVSETSAPPAVSETSAPSAAPETSPAAPAAASSPPVGVAEVSPASAPSGSAASGAASPAPLPTATQAPNLLSFKNGTFVRKWTVGGGAGGNGLAMDGLYFIDPKFAKPLSFDFEMPSVAHINRFGVKVRTSVPVSVRIALAKSRDAFHDAATIALSNDDGNTERQVDTNGDARWVRFTFTRKPGTEVRIFEAAAYGTAGPPERGSFAGTWVLADSVSGDADVMFPGVKGAVPEALPQKYAGKPHRTLVQGPIFTDFWCDRTSPAWHGTVAGNIVTGAQGARLQLAGDGKLLVGYAPDVVTLGGIVMMRDTRPGSMCAESDSGSGPTVLALMRDGSNSDEPEIQPAIFPGFHYHRAIPMLVNGKMLARAQFAVLIGDCTASTDLLPSQQQTLLNWVAAGHKLILRDSDMCRASDYSFIPYKFATVATGAQGARGSVLSIADPSTLGSGPRDPAHFLDTVAYVNSRAQDIGDADIMQTKDVHWCGHLFSRNVQGASGWAHAYARFGRGLIIYNGLDRDDLRNNDRPALALVRYEYQQPVHASLPCNVRVASALALYPSSDRSLAAGSPATLRVPLSLTYVTKGGSDQHVTLTIAGDTRYAASISPASATVRSGQTIPVIATISLPKGWSGVHAFTVNAAGLLNAESQASITLDGSIALAKAFQRQRRVRIYGIHFDVDSATILAQSEATIAQIAQVLRANPSWRMRVEGYTDSDGGAAYNLNLSNRRAHAVVSDLVARYRIASGRLSAAGFGLTHPVAPNATAGGKALNRRVELVRL